MDLFGLYVFGMMPVFLTSFIVLVKKNDDVSVLDLVSMTVASFLPFLRECILILLIVHQFGHPNFFDKVVFKQDGTE